MDNDKTSKEQLKQKQCASSCLLGMGLDYNENLDKSFVKSNNNTNTLISKDLGNNEKKLKNNYVNKLWEKITKASKGK